MSGVQVMGTTYTSSGPYMYIEFVSDATHEGAGYSIKYVIEPPSDEEKLPIHIGI